MKSFLVLIAMLSVASVNIAQKATISEQWIAMNTYSFYDPNPVVNPDRIYPYFRFDGYEKDGAVKEWKMVVLENDFVKVFVCPDIGGKIWGAIEKSTGKEFLYYNHSVKFRDVAMRGAWSSGGLEYNFGDIGHIPTCATPVDYILKENEDGSVSCVVGAIDLPSGSRWNVEIKLDKDKAYFETIASWHNTSDVPITYYHWMNAAAKANGNLEFIYPGNKRIGHGGEVGDWPYDNGKHIAMYEQNNFGIYKSYHVLNAYANIFGGYWHDDNFGFGHYADYDDKPGKKIWIWGLSDQGMIWEDLLSDGDGQYIEYQAGKLFNQAAHSSTFTPFKHREFMPYDSDIMRELWFPLKETKGMVAASEYGVLNVKQEADGFELYLSPLQKLETDIVISSGGVKLFEEAVNLNPLQLYKRKIKIDINSDFTIEIGRQLLKYDSKSVEQFLERPTVPLKEFNWNSAYGLYVKGLELEKQRRYEEAMEAYESAYVKESTLLPVVGRLALGNYRKAKYETALEYSLQALAIDTYDPLGNYIYGMVNKDLGKLDEAKSGFSISAQSPEYRFAAYTKLAEICLQEQQLNETIRFANKALLFNGTNTRALELVVIASRLNNDLSKYNETLEKLDNLDACNAFVAFEEHYDGEKVNEQWLSNISNELPFETVLDLAIRYDQVGQKKEAIQILDSYKVDHPIIKLWLAYLNPENRKELLEQLSKLSAAHVFPHRKETLKVINILLKEKFSWQMSYYAGLINWHIGCLEEARQCFVACDEEPDFVAYYLSKINLFVGDEGVKQACLKRALEIDSDDWRLNLLLIENAIASKDLVRAENLAKKYHKRYPENAKFGMLYANALMKQEKFDKCLSFLENFDVMPYEGATEGRNIYHEVCLRLAMRALERGQYSYVIDYANKAKLWPLNLGVGKHYDVDERLDDFLIAIANENLGKKEEAKACYEKVMGHQTPQYLNESSKLLWQVLVHSRNNQYEANAIIEDAIKKEPDNLYIQWVKNVYAGSDAMRLEAQILSSNTTVQAYDTKFVDVEFFITKDFYTKLLQLGLINKFVQN
ncbi:DUF5107 domain-containing protein [Carboxylicivirga sediminis]|uniref:DUF5107 domain-containing protein n=1 Tax=Carboxylicivirga sediminis TaxID=2006564 RepID=A0A941F565_9BACT|nr:DUF5107 domain-containing protein [Carboxylicivirga sediminis]MBR8535900.1 DUF5107 domain-containing protein [Carboxylicivirga sediminis]